LREAVAARAKSEGVSLNVWVERTLAAALSAGERSEPDRMSAIARPGSASPRAPVAASVTNLLEGFE